MRVLAFSDVHRDLDAARRLVDQSADADLVVCAGDLASIHEGLEETVAALAAIERPTVLVPGNNETDDALRAACAGWPSARVLHGEADEFDGVPVFGLGGGIPTTPWAWSFDLAEDEAAAALAGCPEGALLVVHSPPKGAVDGGLGSAAIRQTIEEKRPRLAVCGHIHDCWGQEATVGETRTVNLGPRGAVFDL